MEVMVPTNLNGWTDFQMDACTNAIVTTTSCSMQAGSTKNSASFKMMAFAERYDQLKQFLSERVHGTELVSRIFFFSCNDVQTWSTLLILYHTILTFNKTDRKLLKTLRLTLSQTSPGLYVSAVQVF